MKSIVACLLFFVCIYSPIKASEGEHLKVYVMVGMHVDMYHSWRGDTPDEMGYGYDNRIITSSLKKLNLARSQNKKAKVYWDFAANNWTFGEFLPKHFPELIDLWKSQNRFSEFINYKKLETYKDFSGIRIEEDLLITDNGSRILGKSLNRGTEKSAINPAKNSL